MDSIIWILIAIFTIIVILAFLAILATKGKKRPTDYYSFFIMGILWTGAGIPLKLYPLSVMGIIFLMI